jgi:hypothetical protein
MIIEILLGIIIFVLIIGFAFIGSKLEDIHNALAVYMPKHENISSSSRDTINLLEDILQELAFRK